MFTKIWIKNTKKTKIYFSKGTLNAFMANQNNSSIIFCLFVCLFLFLFCFLLFFVIYVLPWLLKIGYF